VISPQGVNRERVPDRPVAAALATFGAIRLAEFSAEYVRTRQTRESGV
jgi:hypothetical protein